MEIKTIECQGLPCPKPVLKVKEFLNQSQEKEFIVIVDNKAAQENVSRFLAQQGYEVIDTTVQDNEIKLRVKQAKESKNVLDVSQNTDNTLIFITKNRLGEGSEELGKGLIKNFISTLKEMSNLWRIVMVNSGVKLATKDSPVLSQLKELEEKGVSILVCGTCLNYYNLLEEKEVGDTTNMLDIITSLEIADKVITI
ncbi:MAG: hypothetical protein PWR24_1500 [Desulfonauticus sp.]|jgi:selenium metabolism protein YedF|nr:MAG: SirA family protein [Desulfonauticus sp. 38_4375]MDK2921943.1 hypothetical protein [Desulfonauticus sp.]